ncbi:MAG: THUMP domain-containing protein [Thermoprotei archaeon]
MDVALLTAITGKEHRCREEIENALMPYDPEVRVVQLTKASFLVRSNLMTPEAAVALLKRAPPTCGAKVFPVHLTEKADLGSLTSAVAKYVSSSKRYVGMKFYVDCITRSGSFDCRKAELAIGIALRGVATVDFKSPDYVIFVNVYGDTAFVSFVKRGEEKLSAGSPRLNI